MQAQPLLFTLRDDSPGYEVSPQRVPMAVLRSFSRDVEELLQGDGAEVDVRALDVSVVSGSLAIRTAPIAAPGLWRDLRQLAHSQRLEGLEKKRRDVIERWQRLARNRPRCVYGIAVPEGAQTLAVRISATTDFHADDADQWVLVERYLRGEIVEMGGARRATADLRLPDGSLLPVEAEREVLRDDRVNRLYKVAMARVRAEYNVVTRKYRNARLLGFEEHQPALDEAQLSRLMERGAQAWSDVPHASAWVDALRGGAA